MCPISTTKTSVAVYHIYHSLTSSPLCEICNLNICNFRNSTLGYGSTCSRKCAGTKAAKANIVATDQNERMIKMKATNLEKYGVEHQLQRKEIKQKQEETMELRYGAKHAVYSDELKIKTQNTHLKTFGVPYYFQSQVSRERSRTMMLHKRKTEFFKEYFIKNYGVDSFHKTDEYFKRKLGKSILDLAAILDGRTLHEIAEKEKISLNVLKRYLTSKNIKYKSKYHQSSFEREILEYVKSLDPNLEIESRNIKLLNGKELDIYIPSKKIAIECNGIFYHSEFYKDKNYHIEKYKHCKELGIQLIQITDIQFKENKQSVKDLIASKLGYSLKSIGARKCVLKSVSSKDSLEFLSKNHMQGSISSSIRIGLYYKNILVSLMTFSKSRFSKKYDWELTRFCSLDTYNIPGAFSKLLKYFTKTYMLDNQLIGSYSNCNWSIGSVYKLNGFKFSHHTGYSYIWTNSKKYLSRYQCQVAKLKKQYGEVVLSEEQFMQDILKMYRYYDAGNELWIKKKEPEGSLV